MSVFVLLTCMSKLSTCRKSYEAKCPILVKVSSMLQCIVAVDLAIVVGTVVELKEAAECVLKFQQSREFKCDKVGYINMPVGKVSIAHVDKPKTSRAQNLF